MEVLFASCMCSTGDVAVCWLYVIHQCKTLKQLDCLKVKQKEREEAVTLSGSAQQPADSPAQAKPTTCEPGEELAEAEAAAAAAQHQLDDLPSPNCIQLVPLSI